MDSKQNFFIKSVQALTLLMLALCAQPLWAKCSFNSGYSEAKLTFTLPTINVPQDSPVGTVLYSGTASSPQMKVKCTASGEIWQGYMAITASDFVTNSPLTGVYATKVPGIGVRANWGNSGTVSFSDGGYIRPWAIGVSKVGNMTYTLNFNAVFELVVTGPVSSGTLTSSDLTANWRYDNLQVASLNFTSSSVNVTGASCDLVEKNINIPLKTLSPGDFAVYDTVLKAGLKDLKIQLVNCSPGILVDFKISSSGSTGITADGYTLNIATGLNTAKGVGLRLVRPDGVFFKFNQVYTLTKKTTDGQSITIPIGITYIKLGDVTAGSVSAIATFEINYR